MRKNICIKIEVKEIDNLASPGLNCIYAPKLPTGFVSEVYTTVQYHVKSPNFAGDEFKILLPPKLSEKHHILCTFLDIQVAKKKKSESHDMVVGYAVIPLYTNGRIAVHNTDNNYFNAYIHSKIDLVNYIPRAISEARSTFQIQFQLVSTIYPEDLSITQFLNVYHASEEEVSDNEIIKAMKKLRDLSEFLAIQYKYFLH